MTMKACHLLIILLAGCLSYPVGSAFAILVDGPGAILVVDGKPETGSSPDTTVTSTIVNSSLFTFGFVDGGIFTPLVGALSSGSFTFAGGAVVDFALDIGSGVFRSLTDPTDYADREFLTPLDGATFAEVPGSFTGFYYNTLVLNWDINGSDPGGSVGITFLNAGAGDNDGFAAVPIPPVALLFGTGLIGLIGIARRSLFVN